MARARTARVVVSVAVSGEGLVEDSIDHSAAADPSGMTNPHHRADSNPLAALERSRSRWRSLSVALLCLGAGFAMGGLQAQPTRRLQAMVLDPNQSSGAWSSTLIAVDADGSISYLDTTKQNAEWKKFRYSPR